jgi:hypothetical protein
MGGSEMTIKINVEVEAPLTGEDLGLLTGISVALLAIANRPLAEQRFPETFSAEEPQPCGAVEVNTGFSCVNEVGHRGRHRYRDVIGDVVAAATGDSRAIN